MTSEQPFSLQIQPNNQAKPQKPTPRKREPKEGDWHKQQKNYWDHHQQPATDDETTFRHSHWKPKRDRITTILQSVNTSTRTMDAWHHCGSDCQVLYSPSEDKHKLAANYCHSRHCEPCMRAKANRLAANLKKRLAQHPNGRYRFITLTLRHSRKPLADQLKRLYASFKALRKTPLWKKSQRGGALTVEVKWSPDSSKWHPHLHVIAEGEFLAQADLSAAWERITKDSKIVDIRQLKSGHDAAHYVSKYVTKGTSNEVWKNTNAAQEWITASKGLRCCATFGTWRGFKLLEIDKTTTDWQPLCTLDHLIKRAKQGDPLAQAIYLQLRPPGDHDVPKRPTPPLGPIPGYPTTS